jgi:hypothetical protein
MGFGKLGARENIVNLENRKTGKKMAGNRFEYL